jgi:hypothetical protein
LSWKTAPLFRNNVRIKGCTWICNLSMYFLAVIQPWRVIMGPTEYHDIAAQTITEPPPCFTLGTKPGILDCRHSWLFSNCKLFLRDVGNCVKGDLSDHITCAFIIVWYPGFMVATLSFTHLSITFTIQRFSNCSPTMDVGFVKLTSDSFCGNGLQDEYSVLLSSAVLFQNRTSLQFSDSFIWTVTQYNHWCTAMSTTECKQMEERSVLPAEVLSV